MEVKVVVVEAVEVMRASLFEGEQNVSWILLVVALWKRMKDLLLGVLESAFGLGKDDVYMLKRRASSELKLLLF
jgi:hypothetical protein